MSSNAFAEACGTAVGTLAALERYVGDNPGKLSPEMLLELVLEGVRRALADVEACGPGPAEVVRRSREVAVLARMGDERALSERVGRA